MQNRWLEISDSPIDFFVLSVVNISLFVKLFLMLLWAVYASWAILDPFQCSFSADIEAHWTLAKWRIDHDEHILSRINWWQLITGCFSHVGLCQLDTKLCSRNASFHWSILLRMCTAYCASSAAPHMLYAWWWVHAYLFMWPLLGWKMDATTTLPTTIRTLR